MSMLYDCTQIETLRAITHMLGVKITRNIATQEIRLYIKGIAVPVLMDTPAEWRKALLSLHGYGAIELPDYVVRWPLSALDEITDLAGLMAFCDLLGVIVGPARFANYEGEFSFRGQRAQFNNSDPFKHKKFLVQTLIQAGMPR